MGETSPIVAGLVSSSTARSYRSYWARAEAAWGERRLNEVSASDIRAQAEKAKATAVVRRNSRGGRSAAENFVADIRCLYRYAEDDGLIDEHRNPARRVTKHRRASPRPAAPLPDERLSEIINVVATGDDVELDTLLVRLHVETACRRGGALALRLRDLDTDQCLLFLREKAETVR